MDDVTGTDAHDGLLPEGDDDELAGLHADFPGWTCERLPPGKLHPLGGFRAVRGAHRADADDAESLRRHITELKEGRGLTADSAGVWSGIQK